MANIIRTVVMAALILALLNVTTILDVEIYEQGALPEHTTMNQSKIPNRATTTTRPPIQYVKKGTKTYPTEIVKGVAVIKSDNWAATIEGYLKQHQRACEKDWSNKYVPQTSKHHARKLCDCTPKTILGPINVTFEDVPLNETERNNPEVLVGGSWEPKDCIPRYRVSIIVPFRNRTFHLHVLLRYLHPILQGQQIAYNIIVVEQRSPRLFNKASLMNVGYVYTMREHHPDCVIFHDVDRIPEDGRHFYYCPLLPYHLGAYHDEHKYRIMYKYIFGAVTAFRPSAFVKVNGFSNRFWGWGAEDDDMSMRVNETFQIDEPVRPPLHLVAGYKTIRHQRDPQNIGNRTLNRYIFKVDRRRKLDGLNSMSYSLNQVMKYPLYTWVHVDLKCTHSCRKAQSCKNCK